MFGFNNVLMLERFSVRLHARDLFRPDYMTELVLSPKYLYIFLAILFVPTAQDLRAGGRLSEICAAQARLSRIAACDLVIRLYVLL